MIPTQEQVALAAANYAVREFTNMDGWLSHEKELAEEWLKNAEFRCAVDLTIQKVADRIQYSKQMQSYAAERGGGARGFAAVAGAIVGEWTSGHTTINNELNSWGY